MTTRTIACLLVLSACLAGCSKPAVVEVSLDTEFTLAVGESATIAGEDLSLQFVEMVSDSRCPTGAICIWAGEASCLMRITQAGSTYEKVLTQPGHSSPSTESFAGYEVTFDILPYPELGKDVRVEDYVLRLTVSR
jgi:hypothetical protein